MRFMATCLNTGPGLEHQARALVVHDGDVLADQRRAGGHADVVVAVQLVEAGLLPVERLAGLEVDAVQDAVLVDVHSRAPARPAARRGSSGRAIRRWAGGGPSAISMRRLLRLPCVPLAAREVGHAHIADAADRMYSTLSRKSGAPQPPLLVGIGPQDLAVGAAEHRAALEGNGVGRADAHRDERGDAAGLRVGPGLMARRRVEGVQAAEDAKQLAAREGRRARVTDLLGLEAADPLAVAVQVVAGHHAVAEEGVDVLAVADGGRGEADDAEVGGEMPVPLELVLLLVGCEQELVDLAPQFQALLVVGRLRQLRGQRRDLLLEDRDWRPARPRASRRRACSCAARGSCPWPCRGTAARRARRG